MININCKTVMYVSCKSSFHDQLIINEFVYNIYIFFQISALQYKFKEHLVDGTFARRNEFKSFDC